MPETDRFNSEAADSSTESRTDSSKNAGLLKKIREDYRFCLDYWAENREEMETDMRFVSGNPWTNQELQARKDQGRPALSPDEISQYLKQANNNVRQNKRAIKVIPKGAGAADKDALKRSAIIRGIEYQSNAQAAYTRAFEGATSCGFGFWRITTRTVSGQPWKEGVAVEPRIATIPNQFTVLLGPEAKEPDFSDQDICFVTDVLRKNTFGDKYPNATKRSFTIEDQKMAPDWFKGESIIIAEYWCRKDGKVTQYITNGVEILEENPWPGSWIPIIPVLGEEIYTADSGASKRMYLSLIRRARVPQKMLCFIASQEAEEFGMAPRTPLLLWEGQEQADKEALTDLNTVPRAFVKIKPTAGPNNELLPFLGRHPFAPNAQAYEIARESWRRAIQAAMGLTPLPTAAQRQNEKSGIALERIQTQQAIGSYHSIDNLDRALENTGRQLNELITKIIDTPRHMSGRNPDDSHSIMQVMAAEYAQELPDSDDFLITDRGEFDVTISTGPSSQSQREMQSDFADTVLKELAPMAAILPPGTIPKLAAQVIRLKDVGPIGDDMAKLLDPEDDTAAQLGQAQQQAQAMQQQMGELQAENEKMKLEKAGKVIDNEYKAQEGDKDREVKLAVAEITTKQQSMSERVEMIFDLLTKLHISAHEAGMQAQDHAHQHSIADKTAANAAMQQAQAGAQQSDQSAQDHAQGLEAQEAAAQQEPAQE